MYINYINLFSAQTAKLHEEDMVLHIKKSIHAALKKNAPLFAIRNRFKPFQHRPLPPPPTPPISLVRSKKIRQILFFRHFAQA
jgi:hypothetical protein